MRWFLSFLLLLPLSLSAEPVDDRPQVVLETSLGNIVLELDQKRAPNTVANFLQYVDAGFYDGTLFHRVIPDFMIQGGGFGEDYLQKPTRGPIDNEADNGLRNTRGTIAMARTRDPHSATAQFFINSVDNRSLDHTAKTPAGWGYTVFGQVIEGLNVVERISATRTGSGRLNGHSTGDVPVMPVLIKRAARVAQENSEENGD
ncbi:MAG: cyclophilin [Gammaproteobacteria bacterium HGW-Gammaproteobacteria-14]|nr:MAG: cyclophilin [Gammaproteobacteria bacterium HGW-Gammaproteobacteria-14]